MTLIQGRLVKTFQYVLLLDGIPTLTMQKVTTPDFEVGESTHSAGIYDQKTPTKIKVGDLVCEKLMSLLDANDDWHWKWIKKVANFSGIDLDPNYAKSGELRVLDVDLTTIAKTYQLGWVWPKKIAGQEWDSMGEDNMKDQITFSVSTYELVTN